MLDFVNYIYESGISLGLFSLLYFLFLQRETFFRTNRLFLLFALVFSVALPLIHLRVFEPQPVLLGEITVTPYPNLLETVSVYGKEVSSSIVSRISTQTWIAVVYGLGALFFSLRLVLRLVQLFRIVRKHEVIREQGVQLVILDEEAAPFSFLGYVFAGRNLKQTSGWEKMLMHEIEHVKQGHSVDILVLEILTIFQWFNPFFWLMKRLLRENHEYLADRAVLAHEANPANYKRLLVQQFIGPEFELANNFNYSLIKKRIQMMSKIESSKIARIKLVGGLVLAAALIAVFSLENKVTANANERKEPTFEVANSVLSSKTNMHQSLQDSTASLNEKHEVRIEQLSLVSDDKRSDTESLAAAVPVSGNSVVSLTKTKSSSDTQLTNVGKRTVTILRGGASIQLQFEDEAKFEEFKSYLKSKDKMEVVADKENEFVVRDNSITVAEAKKKAEQNKSNTTKSTETVDGEPVFFIVDDMPEFPGGENALRDFIAHEVKYPVEAQKAKIQGKVYVNFVVDKEGKVRNAKIARGVAPSLDAEALRVVSALPVWTPGKQKGEPVAVSYTVPIKFALE